MGLRRSPQLSAGIISSPGEHGDQLFGSGRPLLNPDWETAIQKIFSFIAEKLGPTSSLGSHRKMSVYPDIQFIFVLKWQQVLCCDLLKSGQKNVKQVFDQCEHFYRNVSGPPMEQNTR